MTPEEADKIRNKLKVNHDVNYMIIWKDGYNQALKDVQSFLNTKKGFK